MTQQIVVGQIVFSKSGRDKGLPFVVCIIEDNFVYLIDGNLRKMENPKKKNVIHIQKTNHMTELADVLRRVYETGYNKSLANQHLLKDSDIKKTIIASLTVTEEGLPCPKAT